MTFGSPSWLWALLVLPMLAFLFVRAERRSTRQLRNFVSPRLLPELAGTVDRLRRTLRFAMLLAAVAGAICALAQPRWGYTYVEVKRKGLDLLLAVDTSRSMLSNDVAPSRLERVKLATQDLINELPGDRVGLIAFAGRAFLQAPLTIDYGAAVDAINDLDTNTIPEGGTNISEAIDLAVRTYGKSAIGNRGLIIFTDGEELNGDAVKTAKAAADAGVRIFAIGVGTPEGSLIPISGEGGGTAFVKDAKGQVVKSKLDEKRLREIAETTGGFYLHLENGQRTMRQLFGDGLSKMQAAQIDDRMSQKPIERYQWPLGAALVALVLSVLMRERKRTRSRKETDRVLAATAALLIAGNAQAAAPGLDAYRSEKFSDAYQEFQQTLKQHPQTHAADKIEFDAGAAAYKMKDYGKALESFSRALLSPDAGLQSRSHYNLGNTLYERGEAQKTDEKKLGDWTDALKHYDQTLKLDPGNQEAKDNSAFVKQKIEELKKKKEEPPTPTPTPSPSPSPQKKDDQKKQDEQKKQEKDQQKKPDDKSGGEQQKPDKGDQKDPGKKQDGSSGQDKKDEPKPGEKPSPGDQSPTGSSPSPSSAASPSAGENSSPAEPSPGAQPNESPTPGESGDQSPSPSPAEGAGNDAEGKNQEPSPSPSGSPSKAPGGEVKAAAGDAGEKPETDAGAAVEAEAKQEGSMSEQQAERLLRSMKNEEERVQLDERKPSRRVYNDW